MAQRGAELLLIVLVCSCTTRLSAACNMYLPCFSLSAPCHSFSPNSRSPLYMLELSLKRLAILLDCAVVLKTRRIAPVCIGVASQTLPLPLPSGILLPWPGRDLCAYAKHTVCLKTRGGKRVRPFLRVGSSFFCFARHAKGCSSSCSPFPISFSFPFLPAYLVVLSGCASFRLLWHFSYAFLLVF